MPSPAKSPARRTRSRLAVALSATALLLAGASCAFGEEAMLFEGVVEAARQGALAPHVSGVVSAIRFEGGETVAAGQTLIELDDAAFRLAVEDARAALEHAEAEARAAGEEAERSEALSARGVATETRLREDRTRLAQATALRRRAEIAFRRAELDLARTRIVAPLSGVVSRPAVALGAFVEAEAGPPLATVVQLDPALVAYSVPYSDRLATLAASGEAGGDVEALLARIALSVSIPGVAGERCARPSFAGATVDEASGALTIWSEVANPDHLLRPGLRVEVTSVLGERNADECAGAAAQSSGLQRAGD